MTKIERSLWCGWLIFSNGFLRNICLISFQPYCYVRKVEDIFVNFASQSEANRRSSIFEQSHPSLKFTMEEEYDIIMAFFTKF